MLTLNVGGHFGTSGGGPGGGAGAGRGGGPTGGTGLPAGRQPSRARAPLKQRVPCGLSMQTPPWSSASTAVAQAADWAQAAQHFACAAACEHRFGGGL